MPTYEYKCINGHKLELTFPSWDAMKFGEDAVKRLGVADNKEAMVRIGGCKGGQGFCKQFICQQCGELLKRQVTAPVGFKGL